ncbi:ATP-binding protein [Cupriavidus taiwanensis]|uniref:ATP-binding protein n=1 Tax=Cupriavidus taiwanensis TaxID=164546 RepID=UPI00157420A4|nr:ATP-binding protein [Cupriavidus taiwanensis]NSX14037.1 ATP-binding protein [Cupriavidus taiwanensis]
MAFAKAVRKKAKLRLALTGPSGSGKTFGALMIAKGLGGRIACIDTEHGSASLYSDLADFDVMELTPPYTPERYIAAIREAEKAGYDTLIIDSTTHEWSGSGGILELVDQVAAAKFRGNSWSAWNELTPRHRSFIDAMLQSRMHIITTARSKTETAQTEGPNGKKQVVKLGMKAEQRDGFEYEFTVVLDIVHAGHYATASKDRTGLFRGDALPITEETGRALLNWLESGAEPAPEPSAPASEGLVLDDALLALRESNDLNSLKDTFGRCWKAATKDQQAELKAVYDECKTALEALAAAAQAEPA